MKFSVYMILARKNNRYISYVGYTINLKNRLALHNASKGAKYTRGSKWFLIYKKTYNTKSQAMKEEYKLKKNYLLRKMIKEKHLNK